ncbi:hypothetical protein KHA80_04445 [Anaerobacillus sp. HL2]|nr:hypothetical protein KHA80_04445 [Anaerobacillus sp. HL2]
MDVSLKWLIRFVSLLVFLLCCYVFLLISPILVSDISNFVKDCNSIFNSWDYHLFIASVVEQMKTMGVATYFNFTYLYRSYCHFFLFVNEHAVYCSRDQRFN